MEKTKKGFGLAKKLLIFVIVAIIVTAGVSTTVGAIRTGEMLRESTKSNMLNIAVSYGALLDMKLTFHSVITASGYESMFKDVSIDGYPTGYLYLVDKDGIVLYHPNSEIIGEPFEDPLVSGLIAQIQADERIESAVVTYDANGSSKIAAYSMSMLSHSILVCTLDEADVDAEVQSYILSLVLTVAIAGVVLIIIALVVALGIVKPFKALTKVAGRLASLDLTEDENTALLITKSDEAGEIARAFESVRAEFLGVVKKLNDISTALHDNAVNVQSVSNSINEQSNDNSATTEELAASMQETAATTQNIDSSVAHIQERTESIADLANEGNKLAREIMQRADALKASSKESISKTQSMLTDVKAQTDAAIAKSRAVEKINELTDSIKAIAAQTNLLSLNASIEAARAGDQGRGFAVVAGEIGNLASQSTDAVNNISSIVSEVQLAVNEMAQCMNKTLSFLEETVATDYVQFGEVGEKYFEDAESFDSSMGTISTSSVELKDAIGSIVIAINGINQTVSEATDGISDIADKTNAMVEATTRTGKIVDDNLADAKELQEIVDQFTF